MRHQLDGKQEERHLCKLSVLPREVIVWMMCTPLQEGRPTVLSYRAFIYSVLGKIHAQAKLTGEAAIVPSSRSPFQLMPSILDRERE
jgi:hypothetical protein